MKLTMVLVEIRAGFPGFSGHYSEGVASLAAVTRRSGHEFELVHLTRPAPVPAVARRIALTRPDVVGFSCMTHTFGYVRDYAPAVKSALPKAPIVLGGVHATLNPEECLAAPGLDAVCVGEGEGALEAMLSRLAAGRPLGEAPGLWAREDGTIRRNPVLPLVEDLDALPQPDRSVFDFPRLMATREGVLYVSASRGCPYACRFCCNAAIRERYPNRERYVRFKSVGRLCREIETVLALFPGRPRGIYFQDDILPANQTWFAEFAEVFPRRIALPFNCNLRADLLTEDLAARLKAAGCAGVSIGLESGTERLRNSVLGKSIPDFAYDQAARMLRAAGIRITSFSMVGLPGETADDALRTVQRNADLRVDRACVSIFCPYPGTALHEDCRRRNLLSGSLPDTYQDASPLLQETIRQPQAQFVHDYFGLLVSLARRPRSRLRAALWRAIRRNAPMLRVASRAKRGVRRALSLPYLYAGRFLFNRQRRVFRRGRR